MRLPPDKSLGQNFLSDRFCRKIVQTCAFTAEDNVLEIGPGKGALTSLLAGRVKHLWAVEKDERMVRFLRERLADAAGLTLVHADILAYSFDELPAGIKVVGNLPYNIATPIIRKVLGLTRPCAVFYAMLQKEYAQRLAARPSTKAYGALSCFVQFHAEVKVLWSVPPGAFSPPPKVHSSFVRLCPRATPPVRVWDKEAFFRLIRHAFQQRRKTIGNALGNMMDKQRLKAVLNAADIPARARPEDLSLADFARLAEHLKKEK